MKRFLYSTAILMTLLGASALARADYMIWTDNANFGTEVGVTGDIRRANLDGTGQRTLVTGLIGPNQIAANLSDGRIYWVDGQSDNNTGDVRRANLDGSGQQTIVSNQYFSIGVAVDPAAGNLYWRAHIQQNPLPYGEQFVRSGLDGSNPQVLFQLHVDYGNGQMALDTAGGKMYFTDYNDGLIERANLDGTGVTTLVRGLDGPVGIALDLAHGTMYWCNSGGFSSGIGQIERANLDGSSPHVLISGLPPTSGIALDVPEGKMFWTDSNDNSNPTAGEIRSANLDGTNERTVVTGLNTPFALTIVPEPNSLMVLGLLGAALFRSLRR